MRTVAEHLRRVVDLVEDLPSGLDYDADPDNPSPSDMAAHIGGLIYREAQAALAVIEAPPPRAFDLGDPSTWPVLEDDDDGA